MLTRAMGQALPTGWRVSWRERHWLVTAPHSLEVERQMWESVLLLAGDAPMHLELTRLEPLEYTVIVHRGRGPTRILFRFVRTRGGNW